MNCHSEHSEESVERRNIVLRFFATLRMTKDVMLNKNNIAIGFLSALIFPAIAWAAAEFIFKNSALILNKPAAPYLIAIAFNLFIIRYCFKNDNDQTGIGAIICTFIIMMLVFLFKMRLYA